MKEGKCGLKQKFILGLLTFAILAGLTTGCTPTTSQLPGRQSPTPEGSVIHPETINNSGSMSLPFLLAMTGIRLPEDPNKSADAMAQLQKLIDDPVQYDNFMATMISNQNSILAGNVPTEQAIAEGRSIGATLCPDDRGFIMAKFKAIVLGKSTEIFVKESRFVGAQPSLFQEGVNKSLFFSHQVVPACEGGISCGFLGGVEQAILKGDVEASQILAKHGVPEETIGYILKWKSEYGQHFIKDGLTAEKWAEVGGEIQAYINASAQKSGRHITLWGVQTNGTGAFEAKRYVEYIRNADGITFSRNSYSFTEGNTIGLAPELAGAADFLNQPHPMIESMSKQIPKMNVISSSKLGVTATFGSDVIKPEVAFSVSQLGGEVTSEAIDSLGYSIGALKQNGKILYLSADNATEMIKLRQALLGSSFGGDLLKNGWLIVEVVPDPVTGLFKSEVVLRTYENPLILVTLSPEEDVLVKNGARKIIGALRITDKGGDTMKVMVRSAKNGQDYILDIPKGTIPTAEALEAAGLPAVEAFGWESAIVKSGKFLGKVGIVTGLLLMAYDGVNCAIDMMGYGEFTEFSKSDYADLNNTELHQSILDLGLQESPANIVYVGNAILDRTNNLISRIDNNRKLFRKGVSDIPEDGYYIKLDAFMANILYIISDGKDDINTPIKIVPVWHEDRNGYPNADGFYNIIIDSISYINTANGESITMTNNYNGTFSHSGQDTLKFNAIINKPGTQEFISIPLEFKLNEKEQEMVSPKFETKEMNFEDTQMQYLYSNYADPVEELAKVDNKYIEQLYQQLFGATVSVINSSN